MYRLLRLLMLVSSPVLTAKPGWAQAPMVADSHSTFTLGSFSGRVFDDEGGLLEGATVVAMDQQSRLFLKYAVSDANGFFSLPGLPAGRPVEIVVSFSGYMDTSAIFHFNDSTSLYHSGDWNMRLPVKELQEVTVTGKIASFILTKDAIEFHVGKSTGLPAGMAKDLLKKMPGVKIDENGTVTFNGKKIDRIRVDGRDFFGSKLSAALENIPSAIIDRIQVTDSRDPDEDNTGIMKKAARTKTLDLILKKESRLGYFGNVEAALGPAGPAMASGFTSVMQDKRRLAISAGTSNTSTVNNGDVLEGDVDVSRPEGMVKTAAGAAANLNATLGRFNIDMRAGADRNHVLHEQVSERQYFPGDSSLLLNSRQAGYHQTRSAGAIATLSGNIDSCRTLFLETGLQYKEDLSVNKEAFSLRTPGGIRINEPDYTRQRWRKNLDFSNRLIYGLSSRDRRTHLSFFGDQRLYRGNEAQFLMAQPSTLSSGGTGGRIGASVRQQLSQHWTAELKYEWSLMVDHRTKDLLDYRNITRTHRPSVNMAYAGAKLSAAFGSLLLYNRRQGSLSSHLLQDNGPRQNYFSQHSLAPYANLQVHWNKYLEQGWLYAFSTVQPATDQLSPIPDNMDPLVLRQGNPMLTASNTQQLGTSLLYMHPGHSLMGQLVLDARLARQKIVADRCFDSTGRQLLSYRNADRSSAVDGFFSIDKAFIRNDWRIRVSQSGNINYDVDQSFIDQQPHIGRLFRWCVRFDIMAEYDHKIEISAALTQEQGRMQYSSPGIPPSDSTITRSKIRMADTKITGARFRLSIRPLAGLDWTNSLVYTCNPTLPGRYQRMGTVWNTHLSYRFGKGQSWTAYVMANDLLNQGVYSLRTVSADAIESSQTSLLKRYWQMGMKFRFNSCH